MRKLTFTIAVSATLMLSGCSWKKIPEAAAYNEKQNIPITIGVTIPKDSYYGPKVIAELDQAKFFKKIVYPYREDDKVDAVMDMQIKGGWKGSGAAAGFVTGLTLGLAGTAVGPSIEGSHVITTKLSTKTGKQINSYDINASNSVMWGMAANTAEVTAAADALQVKTLTKQLMDVLYKDKDNIEKSLKDKL